MPHDGIPRSAQAGRHDRQRTVFALDQTGRRLSDDRSTVIPRLLEEHVIEGPGGQQFALFPVYLTPEARDEAVRRLLTGEATGYAPKHPLRMVTADVVIDMARVVEPEQGTVARALLVRSDPEHRATITWLPLLVESHVADALLAPTGEPGQYLALVRRGAIGRTVLIHSERAVILHPLSHHEPREISARRALVHAILVRVVAGLVTSGLAYLAQRTGVAPH
jgi:hypothetical protein